VNALVLPASRGCVIVSVIFVRHRFPMGEGVFCSFISILLRPDFISSTGDRPSVMQQCDDTVSVRGLFVVADLGHRLYWYRRRSSLMACRLQELYISPKAKPIKSVLTWKERMSSMTMIYFGGPDEAGFGRLIPILVSL